jgi:membrane associated rhomboid family serine protease
MNERMSNGTSRPVLVGRRRASRSVAYKMLATLAIASLAVFLVLLPSLVEASAAYSLQPIMSPMLGGRRRYRNRSYRQRQRRPQGSSSATMYDYSAHFLDDDNWMTNPKIKLWDVRLNSRRPNTYSWTSKLILANLVGYAAQVMNPKVTQLGIKLSHKILNGQELYRLITPVFLHGGLYHLFTNMYSLNNLGPLTEQLFGSGRFLVSYLVAGATGNLLSSIQTPNPALGASGAVFGVMAGFFVFLNRNDWVLGSQGEAYSSAITQTLLINLVLGAVNPMV